MGLGPESADAFGTAAAKARGWKGISLEWRNFAELPARNEEEEREKKEEVSEEPYVRVLELGRGLLTAASLR